MDPAKEMKVDLLMYEESSVDPSEIGGQINVPGQPSRSADGTVEYNTLDEPIKETIMRDLKAVGTKFWHVMYPREKKALLKEWDLWGPLILCTILAVMLQGSPEGETPAAGKSGTLANDGGPEFAEVFVIVWVGSAVVTLNTKLLGGSISFFQSVCVLGYCLFPTIVALMLCWLVLLFEQTTALFAVRLVITCLGFGWATYASVKFLGDSQPPSRKALGVYPIFLFYFVISWLIISHADS
ncbi:protein YIPF6-like [Amphibalanus amphitrite]|uniref:protein YIPF6-like n=1 Tax=Amphibalanus amphitrite TaxID=1232801 RepID=UPI001C9297A2|nr:protein YIPF6-like [Amphibalanus amphitrite]XP_043246866.1 protein YIPF6-like [Amphibalanus amphitrite]XP_043246875.1 protein YIPF6-like [Amphibalanus amphitrite]XP_043246883.1 protein YIPF6-like [Amphibalanus amphitrite]XP_043246890.1 protein YIPF6-like [Amphibalanus amphitrite]XP_043246898.1 protein YIPF6-like [Amphibalanus amphitrite]XP_043246905.1 protein YIPF6-like [Amphibalanus amphitrite]XP_043246912.1 protein YIPF6-like [Amphibalanus amphitrite]XP_043246920.1 protein YIPF6-like [